MKVFLLSCCFQKKNRVYFKYRRRKFPKNKRSEIMKINIRSAIDGRYNFFPGTAGVCIQRTAGGARTINSPSIFFRRRPDASPHAASTPRRTQETQRNGGLSPASGRLTPTVTRFTLIKLLIVIVIIAILSFPVEKKAGKEKPRNGMCVTSFLLIPLMGFAPR